MVGGPSGKVGEFDWYAEWSPWRSKARVVYVSVRAIVHSFAKLVFDVFDVAAVKFTVMTKSIQQCPACHLAVSPHIWLSTAFVDSSEWCVVLEL